MWSNLLFKNQNYGDIYLLENYNISIIFSLYKDMLNFWVYDIICLLYL